jgi:hypothetical protein
MILLQQMILMKKKLWLQCNIEIFYIFTNLKNGSQEKYKNENLKFPIC